MAIYATGTTGYIGSKLKNSIPIEVCLTEQNSFPKTTISPNSTVIHLAAIVGTQKVLQDYFWARKINVESTLSYAEYLRDQTDARFIFVSSSHVYKDSNSRLTENSPVAPKSLYAKMKLETEEGLIQIYKNAPERLLVARVFSVLGRDMPKETLGWAIEKASANSPVKYSDDHRDFSTANEIAELLEQAAEADWLSTVLNICSGTCRSVRDAGKALRRELALSDDDGIFLPGNSDVPRTCGDNSLLKKTLLSRNES
jgi:nucleoside-diphosphate-sugar epimerase